VGPAAAGPTGARGAANALHPPPTRPLKAGTPPSWSAPSRRGWGRWGRALRGRRPWVGGGEARGGGRGKGRIEVERSAGGRRARGRGAAKRKGPAAAPALPAVPPHPLGDAQRRGAGLGRDGALAWRWGEEWGGGRSGVGGGVGGGGESRERNPEVLEAMRPAQAASREACSSPGGRRRACSTLASVAPATHQGCRGTPPPWGSPPLTHVARLLHKLLLDGVVLHHAGPEGGGNGGR
jgi:hypothetical protein